MLDLVLRIYFEIFLEILGANQATNRDNFLII